MSAAALPRPSDADQVARATARAAETLALTLWAEAAERPVRAVEALAALVANRARAAAAAGEAGRLRFAPGGGPPLGPCSWAEPAERPSSSPAGTRATRATPPWARRQRAIRRSPPAAV